jgi:hypothetical protein
VCVLRNSEHQSGARSHGLYVYALPLLVRLRASAADRVGSAIDGLSLKTVVEWKICS